MFNKLYEAIKKFFRQNALFLLFYVILFFIFTLKLPYRIDAPGGIINISEKLNISSDYKSEGTLNMAYVSEYPATIPTLVLSYFKSDWNISKIESDNQNTTNTNENFRNHILLDEANYNATKVAYQESGIMVEEINTKVYVTYIFDEANTDLKIGDKIIAINGKSATTKSEIQSEIKALNNLEKITLTVINNEVEYERYAFFVEYDNTFVLGILISQVGDLKTTPPVNFNFKDSESGPSGGLMMSLAIYNALNEYDITNGLKIVGTGTINENGEVGQIDGVEYKLAAAVKEGADLFLVPKGSNYNDAEIFKKNKNYSIEIVSISTFNEAIEYLKKDH